MSPYFKKTISFSINLKLFEKNNSYFTAQPKKNDNSSHLLWLKKD